MERYTSDNYLTHYGIKGQSWGVRNGPPYPLDSSTHSKVVSKKQKFQLSDKQKKLLKAGAIAAGSAIAIYGAVKLYKSSGSAQAFRTYGLSDKLSEHLDEYPDGDILLNKGQKLQRVSKNAVEDFSDKGHIYASYLFRDNQRYKSGFRKEFTPDAGKLNFVHTLSPDKDVKIASPRKAAEIFLKQNPNGKDQIFRLVSRPYERFDSDDPFGNAVNNMRSSFIKELKSQGYSGIVDIEDASKHLNASPIILFNPNEYVSVTNSRHINEFETFIADILK